MIQQGYGQSRRAGAREGTADVGWTGAGYELRSPCGLGHAVRGGRLYSFAIAARLTEMMEVIVEVCRAFALIVSAKKTETMCTPPPRTPRTMVQVEATGKTYKQV